MESVKLDISILLGYKKIYMKKDININKKC